MTVAVSACNITDKDIPMPDSEKQQSVSSVAGGTESTDDNQVTDSASEESALSASESGDGSQTTTTSASESASQSSSGYPGLIDGGDYSAH